MSVVGSVGALVSVGWPNKALGDASRKDLGVREVRNCLKLPEFDQAKLIYLASKLD